MPLASLCLVLPLLLTPPPPHYPVDPQQLEGRTLRLTHPDGSEMRIDAPSDEWQWRTYASIPTWDCVLPQPGGALPYRAVISFGRVDQIPSRSQYARTVRRQAGRLRSSIETWRPSTFPEPGSIEYMATVGAVTHSGYFTAHGYHFAGPPGDSPDALRFRAFVESYRIRPARIRKE
jgi:hypothetical protein